MHRKNKVTCSAVKNKVMGVWGLLTFVKNNPELLSDHELHDCRVVIDGNNIMYYLYFNSNVPFEFGGDYDQYASKCKCFFDTLRVCKVEPYVVFDGGYDKDERKLPTVLQRRQQRILDVEKVCSGTYESAKVLPILALETFQHVLKELDIPHVSCQFEADREIAVLAHRWRCPVLSNDGDFFVYSLDGGVIPLDSIGCSTETGWKPKVESSKGFSYIPVELYKYQRFACKYELEFRHLVLPAFASLLGNDFVGENQLKEFFCGFHATCTVPKFETEYENCSKRLVKSLLWLDGIQSITDLFQDVLKYLPQTKRRDVGKILMRSVEDYLFIDEFTSIDLEHFFNCYGVPESERNLESFVFPEMQDFYGRTIPDWIVSALRRCKMNRNIQNAIVLHTMIQGCQIELLSEQSTYQSSRGIRKVMYGLFFPQQTSDLAEEKLPKKSDIVEHDRNRKNMKQFYVPPAREINVLSDRWNIYMTPDEGNRKNRLEILFAAVNSTDYTIPESKTFSNTIKLLIFMLAMWFRGADIKVDEGALKSLLTTILYLNARAFLWYKNELEIGTNIPTPCIIDDVEEACNQSEIHVEQFVDSMKKFTRTPSGRDYRKVHGFSQFQAILMDTIQLNQLLACPVPMLSPGFMYSGTTVYSLCADLDYRSEPDLFIGELMALKSPLHELFKNVLESVINICKEGHSTDTVTPQDRGSDDDTPAQPKDQVMPNSSMFNRETTIYKRTVPKPDIVTPQDRGSDDDTPAQRENQVMPDLSTSNRFDMLYTED